MTYLWHASEDSQGCDAILVPGGFAYGDYLRTGAIAKFAPVMQSVAGLQGRRPGDGHLQRISDPVRGGLLPGALMRNASQHYICKQTFLRTETADSPFTHGLERAGAADADRPYGRQLLLRCGDTGRAEARDRIAFRYATPEGEMTAAANPNGSLDNIAGVLSEGRNVLGMMPHPDRSSEALLGSTDGLHLFRAMAESLAAVR